MNNTKQGEKRKEYGMLNDNEVKEAEIILDAESKKKIDILLSTLNIIFALMICGLVSALQTIVPYFQIREMRGIKFLVIEYILTLLNGIVIAAIAVLLIKTIKTLKNDIAAKRIGKELLEQRVPLLLTAVAIKGIVNTLIMLVRIFVYIIYKIN